jgi:hypothetical protein
MLWNSPPVDVVRVLCSYCADYHDDMHVSSYREMVEIKDGPHKGENVEVLHVIGIKASNYQGSGLLQATLKPPDDEQTSLAAVTSGGTVAETHLRLTFEQPGQVAISGATSVQMNKPKLGPVAPVLSYLSALRSASARVDHNSGSDVDEDVSSDVEPAQPGAATGGGEMVLGDNDESERTLLAECPLLAKIKALEQQLMEARMESKAQSLMLKAEVDERARRQAGQPSRALLVRTTALRALTQSHILPQQQIIQAQQDAGLRKKQKLPMTVDLMGCQTEQDKWSTICGAGAIGNMLKKLESKQAEAKENKEVKAQATANRKQREENSLLSASKIAEPLIDEFLSGRRALDASQIALKKPTGLSLDTLKALCKFLKLKVAPGSVKSDLATKVVEVISARKERLASAGEAATVDRHIVTRNVQAILARPAELVLESKSTRKAAMFTCAQFILFELGLEPYGGFVRDPLIRDDWHSDVDLDVCAPDCKDAADSFVTWLKHLDMACEHITKGVHVHEVKVTGTESPFDVQFVNTKHFESKELRKVDMDVNNLKLTRNGIKKRVEEEGADLDVIITNVQRKQFDLIKPASAVAKRLKKFESRGWQKILTKAAPASAATSSNIQAHTHTRAPMYNNPLA